MFLFLHSWKSRFPAMAFPPRIVSCVQRSLGKTASMAMLGRDSARLALLQQCMASNASFLLTPEHSRSSDLAGRAKEGLDGVWLCNPRHAVGVIAKMDCGGLR